MLVKVLGVHQITCTRKADGKRKVEYAVVMENLFYNTKVVRRFDLKGKVRAQQLIRSDLP